MDQYQAGKIYNLFLSAMEANFGVGLQMCSRHFTSAARVFCSWCLLTSLPNFYLVKSSFTNIISELFTEDSLIISLWEFELNPFQIWGQKMFNLNYEFVLVCILFFKLKWYILVLKHFKLLFRSCIFHIISIQIQR